MTTTPQKLDASRVCILENYRLFEQMKKEEESIWRDYLFPLSHRIKDDIVVRINAPNAAYKIKGYAEFENRWMDFWFECYENWASTGRPLFQVGIESLELKNIFSPSVDSMFWAYLFSSSDVRKADGDSVRKLFEMFYNWPMPDGFTKVADKKRKDQYILVKHFDPITPADFADPSQLTKLLSEPLSQLTNWVIEHWNALSKEFSSSQEKR